MTAAQIQAMRDLYGEPSYVLLQHLPDIAERLQAQTLDLMRYPTPERAERLSLELEGVRRHIARIREQLVKEAGAGGSPAR
jgi:hypothetical protein